jgi:hypothetical protein
MGRLLLGWVVFALVTPVLAYGQLTDDARVSTQGTQFVAPPTPPQAPQAPPPAAVPAPVAPPAVPLVPAPAVVAPPANAPPPRYPSVVILLDVSDSMLAKGPGKEITRLDEAKNAISAVISGMSPETRVQVWTFSTRMAQVSLKGGKARAFTPVGDAAQRDQLIEKIRDIRTGGGTNLYQSVLTALEIFATPRDQAAYRTAQRFPVLAIVSDGEDWGKSGHTLEQVKDAERRLPLVTVNAIGFTVAKDEPWFKTLCALATREEGCATADDQAQLSSMLESFYRPPALAANTRGR